MILRYHVDSSFLAISYHMPAVPNLENPTPLAVTCVCSLRFEVYPATTHLRQDLVSDAGKSRLRGAFEEHKTSFNTRSTQKLTTRSADRCLEMYLFAGMSRMTAILLYLFATPMLQAVFLIILLLLFHYSRRYRLPPGPPGNVTGEFKNATMPEVFEKWRRKYGA